MRSIGEVSAVQISKWWKLTDFFQSCCQLMSSWDSVTVSTDRHATSNSSSKAFGLEAKKAQHWTWLAHLRHLPWPCESTEQQRWAEYSKGWVLIIRPVANSHWLLKQKSKAAASRKYGVSQTGPRGKTSTTTNTHSWDLWAAYNDSW